MMTKENKTKGSQYRGLVKSEISSKELEKLYKLMDDCEEPYSCEIKIDYLGHRWIWIHCKKKDEPSFRKMLGEAMEID